MNSFTFQVPTKVCFGKDCIDRIEEELRQSGTRLLLVYGGRSVKASGLLDKIKSKLEDSFQLYECGGIEPNPKMHSVREGVAICKEHGIEMILALGGGSVIDASKAIAAGACVDFDAWEFFGGPRRPIERSLPVYTVVTMASTGSEMTCGAVINNEDTLEKMGRSGFSLFPKASFLDPTLTFTVPRHQTACGAVDIFSHIFENYFNRDSDFELLDRMMEGAMRAVVDNSRIALANPENYEARGNLLWSASWAINGLFAGGSKQMWSCHPIEHELSARFDITHGLGLAIIMPKWLEYCLQIDSTSTTERKVRSLGRAVFDVEGVEASLEALNRYLYEDMGLPLKLAKDEIGDIEVESLASSICKNGPIKGYCTLDEIAVSNILKNCIG